MMHSSGNGRGLGRDRGRGCGGGGGRGAPTVRSIVTAILIVGYFIMKYYKHVVEYVNISGGSTAITITSEDASLPCTHHIYTSPEYIPISANKQRVEWVEQAQDILTYIFTNLHDAPAILMYGTLLYEYRNSTVGDPCVHSSLIDKDIDIAVYPIHLQQIAAMKYEIEQNFNWEVTKPLGESSYLFIFPTNHWKQYRIDIYGFQYDSTSRLINFQWDGVKISRNAFLPIRKQKQMKSPKQVVGNQTTTTMPNFYVPNNAHNSMCNIYGADYMTPKTGPSSQAKYNGQNGRPAYGNIECGNATVDPKDEQEIERQLDTSLFSVTI